MYVRAIDPGGNKDFVFSKSRNCYTWFYLQPLPWKAIAGAICAGIIIVLTAYLEYRRRQRKAALERYAERRRRRKFKLHSMTEGGTKDWKEYYHGQSNGPIKDKRKIRRAAGVTNTTGTTRKGSLDEEHMLLPPIRRPSSRPKDGQDRKKRRSTATGTAATSRSNKESRAKRRRHRRKREQMIKPTNLADSSSDEDQNRMVHRKRPKRNSTSTNTNTTRRKQKTRRNHQRAADVKDKFR